MGNSIPQPYRNYRTQVVPATGGHDGYVPGSAELGYQFINYLHRPVTVLLRTGVRMIIPYKPAVRPIHTRQGKKQTVPLGENTPRFIIRVKINTCNDVNLDTTELSNDQGRATSVEAQAYLDSIQISEGKIIRRTETTAWVEYHIPAEDFDANGGVLYLQNIDLLVSVLDQASTAPHPHSVQGRRDRDAYDFKTEMAPKGLFYGVYIRDSDRQYGSRFININGTVYGVPVLAGTGEDPDGVYCVTSGRTTSEFVPQRILTEYYSFEDADTKLGLYQTYNEALTLGKPEERFKQQYDERVQKLKLDELQFKEERVAAEREFEQQRDAYKRAQLNLDFELKRLDQNNRLYVAELERREQMNRHQMMVLKEMIELNGHNRRESTEILKLIPTLLTTVATYVAAYKKIKSL